MLYNKITSFGLILIIGTLLFSCKQQEDKKEQQEIREETEAVEDAAIIYEANIMALNADINKNRTVVGDVKLRIEGDSLKISVNASGLEPETMLMQHLHGSPEGKDTRCPGPAADANADGVVDITEITPSTGITMIPLHDNPTNLKIKAYTYPKADEDGYINYKKTVSLDSLRAALKNEYNLEEMDFSKFTYMIHGVGEDANIPESVESAMGKPIHATVPVGCAKLVQSTRN